MEQNPLAKWLAANKLKAYQFAAKADISQGTAYRLSQANSGNFDFATLQAVETATEGEVTIRKMLNWLTRKPLAA